MAHVPLPPLPSDTIFRRIGDKFKDVADDFYTLFERLEDIWLLGKWLRWPFWYMYFWFTALYTLCYTADDKFRDVKRWVDGISDGNTFQELVDWLSDQYRLIRIDPVGWVRRSFTNISHDMWRFLNVPNTWFKDRFDGIAMWFYDLRVDPTGTIRKFLTTAHPFLSMFLFYPSTYIVGKIYETIMFLRELRDSPTNRIIQWIAIWYSWIWEFLNHPISFIIAKVKAFRADVRFFIDNPIAWAKQKIKEVMGWTDYDISDITFYLFRRFLDMANAYVGREYARIRTVACDVLMRFM